MNYGTVQAFKDYHSARNVIIDASLTDAVIQGHLLVASEWVDDMYGDRFFGDPTDGFEQDRQWPRIAAITNTNPSYSFDDDEIPDRVVYATYEAAYREILESGSLRKDFTPENYESVTIEDALSVKYKNHTQAHEIQTQFPVIASLLTPLLDPSRASNDSDYSGDLKRI